MTEYNRREERTGIQELWDFSYDFDMQCDFVMIYGFSNIEARVAHWKEQGYIVHLMTGVSWGDYLDYLEGRFDGSEHWDEAQTDALGNSLDHSPKVPYMVPSVSFAKYLAENLKVAVDAGVEAIHLEEPEFWIHGGYSEAF